MDDRRDDVRRAIATVQLNDARRIAFLDHFHALVASASLRCVPPTPSTCLDRDAGRRPPGDVGDDRIGLVRCLRPMHAGAVGDQPGFEPLEVLGQVGDRFQARGPGSGPHRLRIVQRRQREQAARSELARRPVERRPKLRIRERATDARRKAR
jgi:hypothetical protein